MRVAIFYADSWILAMLPTIALRFIVPDGPFSFAVTSKISCDVEGTELF
jgi:hypothetical protein